MALMTYPELPDEMTYRAHFLESGSLKRDKAVAIAAYADATSRQTAPNGDALLSVAFYPQNVRLFERLVEAIGDVLSLPFGKKGGFNEDGSQGSHSEKALADWHRLGDDNFRARLYHWTLRKTQLDPSLTLPTDYPEIPESLPWDPDPRFQEILDLTQTDRLEEALERVEAIPVVEREVLFDEVIYLRYLLGIAPKGDDLRYLARKYVASSSIKARLTSEFDSFIACLNEALANAGPLPADFPGLWDMSDLLKNDPDQLKRETPPLKNWQATRGHFYRQLTAYGHEPRPRGRIFVWNPDIASGSLRSWQRIFSPDFVNAENAFRRARSIAEIGRGWALETSLVDLVRSIFPDAVHQWRPRFLGSQSVDIYVPSLKLAIEYQGEQHYRAISLFGGEQGFQATVARDERKRALLQSNKIKLLEWRFDIEITAAELAVQLARFAE
ncbi:hypothetical protein HFO91_30735 [Rhizobium leguminosarum]|uniref:hypothetical protein n=1 Tax=Rhizobium leguminosarum TaxID=384 RepID=UPI001C9683A4|nr:hypothetical protein [Rhizobium leguminosarum]MBY5453957.1 hypothetical protein [Rhizobium leguminosarum]